MIKQEEREDREPVQLNHGSQNGKFKGCADKKYARWQTAQHTNSRDTGKP